jgi:hypothetical protein
MNAPDEEMLEAARGVLRFIATSDEAALDGTFARAVTIIENFPPHIFTDAAVWRTAMRGHTRTLSDLAFTLGGAQDFSQSGERAYFVLPTRWTGKLRGRPFDEHGGQSFVLQKEDGCWRVAGYAWAVLEMRFL